MKRFAVLVLAAVLVVSFAANVAFAQEKKESPFKQVILKMMGLTGKTVHKEVNAVGEGVKGATDVVVKEAKDVGALVTGDTSKTKDVLIEPVKGTAEVVGQTANDVITAPIEATKEVYGETGAAKEQPAAEEIK